MSWALWEHFSLAAHDFQFEADVLGNKLRFEVLLSGGSVITVRRSHHIRVLGQSGFPHGIEMDGAGRKVLEVN
jgi:hypothetical protein